MAETYGVILTAENINRLPQVRVDGYNGFAVYSEQKYSRFTLTGNLLSDTPNFNGDFTAAPFIESYRLSARIGEPVGYTLVLVNSQNAFDDDYPDEPAMSTALTSALLIYCGEDGNPFNVGAANEFDISLTLTYDFIPCGTKGKIWPRRVGGTITVYGDQSYNGLPAVSGATGEFTVPKLNLSNPVGVALTEDGDTADTRNGNRNVFRYDVTGYTGVPTSGPIDLT